MQIVGFLFNFLIPLQVGESNLENISLLTKNLPHLQIEPSFYLRVSTTSRSNNSIYSQHCSLWHSQIFQSPLSETRNSRMKANIQESGRRVCQTSAKLLL